MVDPMDIAGLSFQVIHILGPVVKALWRAYRDGKTVHESLRDLHSDLDAVYELTTNIHRLFSFPSFIDAVRGVQNDTNVELMTSLERSLNCCSKEAHGLLEILEGLGLQTREGRMRQAKVQWHLNRRIDKIDRLKCNFQGHKSTMQLAFQLLTTCRQMQIADRDARHADELKVQIGELQKAIEQISQQISVQQDVVNDDVVNDDEQTQLLDDMKDIQLASVHLQRRATLHLEYLTSQSDSITTNGSAGGIEQLIVSEGELCSQPRALPSIREDDGNDDGPSQVTPLLTRRTKSNVTDDHAHPKPLGNLTLLPEKRYNSAMNPLTPLTLEPQDGVRSELHKSLNIGLPSPQSSIHTTGTVHLSSEDFEENISALLLSASAQHMGSRKPFSEELVVHIADMLAAVGKQRWSERPRTYLVLRLINEVKMMDNVILEGFKDIDFPYTDVTLPPCIRQIGAQREFLHNQRYVLSERSADLVRGGRHRHLDKSADTMFEILGKLGSGGFSIVDRVRLRNRLTLQEYARKRIDRNGAFAKNRKALAFFENEVHNLKRLSHEHLVKFVGSYTDRRYIGIIMQPVADVDLHRHLSKEVWTTDELVTLRSWVGCLCSALAYLHDNKCRHKDIKPHNILIKGGNIMLADFGTAFDWTQSENEVTSGPPDAHTKLYVAPEVRLQRPRDTSSDVWSLGCIFLEMATVLLGKSLRSKSEFFESLGTSSAAYWLNHAAIGLWSTQLQTDGDDKDMHLFAWIESMTAMEPTLRPTAKVLVDHISLVQSKETCYIRPCCFDESHSDTTSWQGTDHDDDDAFEITNTPGERTAMTSMDISCFVPETMKTQFTKKHAIHEEIPVPQALLNKSDDELQRTGPSIEEWIGTVGCRNSSESALSSHKASSSISMTSPPSKSLPPGGIEQDNLLLTPAPTTPEPQPDNDFLVTGIMAILEDSSARDSARSEEIEKAFHASHEKLESCLLRLKKEDSDWRSRLSKLIEEPFTDTKGFNLLIIASKFRNEVLAREVVEEVVRKNCKFINDTTIFGNSALHYAAFHGRPKLIKFLLDNGADPSTQNIRGRTALYIALRYDRRDAIEELYVHLSPEQVNARDDHGRTLLHAATNSSSNKIIDLLVASGANTEISDLFGDTALRVAQRARNQDHIDAIRAHMSRNPDKNERPPERNDRGRYDPVINREIVACFCEVCLVRKAVSNAIGHPSKASDTCVCPNHLRSFCRDSISFERGIDAILSFCPCSGCVSGREHNIGNPPCGIPMSSGSLSYDEGLQSAPTIHPPFTEPPTLPSDPDFIDKPIPPYPGHRYYDHLIKKELGTNSSNISPQSMITISLKSLADAGFTGKRSYRRKPQEALEWALTSFLNGFVDAKQAKTTVDILLEHGAQLDTVVHVRNLRWTLLSVAAKNQHLSLMRLLIDKKADLNFQTAACATPLAAAIRSDKALSVRMILEAGAKVNTQTLEDEKIYVKGTSSPEKMLLRRKSTVLHECVINYDQLGWHIPLLLAHGALTDLTDSDGCTPLHIAVKDSRLHAVMVLLESGANVNTLNNARASPLAIAIEGCHIDIVSALLLYGANVNTPSNGHPCALLHALSTSSSEIAALILLEYTRDEKVHRTSSNGLGALHCLPASSKPNMHLLIDLLLARGCKIDAETETGNTPLHIAAYMGKATIVKKLVECGAIAHAQNHHGQTPLHLAQGRHREVVECLGGTFKKSLKETIRKQAETIREQTRPYF